MEVLLWVLAAIGAVVVAYFVFSTVAAFRQRVPPAATPPRSSERLLAIEELLPDIDKNLKLFLWSRRRAEMADMVQALNFSANSIQRSGVDVREGMFKQLAGTAAEVPAPIAATLSAMTPEELRLLTAAMQRL